MIVLTIVLKTRSDEQVQMETGLQSDSIILQGWKLVVTQKA